MNSQKTLTKKISFILVAILSLNLSFFSNPKKVDAFWGIGDVTFTIDTWKIAYDNVILPGLGQVVKGVIKQLILDMTQSTIDWINGKSGKYPSYVNNIGQFIFARGGVMDQGFGDYFAQNSNLNFLCDPFKAQLIIALNLGYANTSVSQTLGCSFYNVQSNVQNAINNGANNTVSLSVDGQTSVTNVDSLTTGNSDGWDTWLYTALQPKNTAIGAYIGAKNELNASLDAKKGEVTATLSYGQGALTFKNCTFDVMSKDSVLLWTSPVYVDYPGLKPAVDPQYQGRIEAGQAYEKEPVCIVKTPGSTITSILAKKANTEQTQDEMTAALSTGIDQIFNAIGNALISKILAYAKDQLSLGVLDNNSASTGALSQELGTIVTTGNNNIQTGLNAFTNGTVGDLPLETFYSTPGQAASETVIVPPADTLMMAYCDASGNHNLMGIYADGSGNTRLSTIQANATNCRGTVNPPDGTALAPQYCNGSNVEETDADGNGGSVTKIVQYNSSKCNGTGISNNIDSTNSGNVTNPPAKTLLQTTCITKDLIGKYADGKGGVYNNIIQTNAKSCGGTDTLAYGTSLTGQYCSSSNLVEVDADGNGGTYIYTAKANATECSTQNTTSSTIYDPLAVAKNNAMSLINSSTNSEQSYKNNFLTAKDIFTQARAVFATSSICNVNQNRPYSAGIRASLINANIITNIDGLNDFTGFRTLAPITFNLPFIDSSLNSTTAKLDTLQKASADVQKASTITAVKDSMTPVNSLSIDDPNVNIVTNVKSWLGGVQFMYDSAQCPIDLTKILQITVASSTKK